MAQRTKRSKKKSLVPKPPQPVQQPVSAEATAGKQGMSSGTKWALGIGIGCCGCLVLIIILIIILMLLGSVAPFWGMMGTSGY